MRASELKKVLSSNAGLCLERPVDGVIDTFYDVEDLMWDYGDVDIKCMDVTIIDGKPHIQVWF